MRIHYGWWVAGWGLLIEAGSLGFGRFGYTLVLPEMKAHLGLSYTQMGLLGTANFFAYIVFTLIAGYLATRYGPRRVILLSLLSAGLSMIGTGFVAGFASALLLRILTGIGSGGSNVPTMGLMSAWFSPSRRGLATGIVVAGNGVGIALAGFLLPLLGEAGGWRASWFALGAATALIGLLAWGWLADSPGERGLRPIGEEPEEEAQLGQPPKEEVRALKRLPILWHLGAVYSCYGFSYIIYATFFVAYLVDEARISVEGAVALWRLVGILSIACGLIWSSLSDVVGRRYSLAIVFGLQALSFLLFSEGRGEGALLASAILFGLTAWSTPSIMAAAAGDYTGPRLASAALGLMTLQFGVGQVLGPTTGGYIADLAGSFRAAFRLSALVAALGLAASLLLRPPRRTSPPH